MPGEAVHVEVAPGFDRVADGWDELAGRAGAPPFLRPGWLAAWWRAFGRGTLELVTLRRGSEVVGAVALARAAGATSSLTNWHTPEFGLLATDAAAAAAVARAVFSRGARRVELWHLERGGRDERAVEEAGAAAGYRLHRLASVRSPFVALDGDWAGYEASLSRNARGDMRRRRRRLEEAGAVELQVESGGERLGELLEEGFRIEGSGWKERRGTAIRSSPQTRRFYDEVARWAAPRGWLRLAFLRLDGRAIAFHYDLVAGGVLYHLKGGFDTEFERFSPGRVLHHLLLERAFEAGLARYDFLGGEEVYKLQFAGGVRELGRLQAFAPTAAGRVELALQAHARPLAGRLLRR